MFTRKSKTYLTYLSLSTLLTLPTLPTLPTLSRLSRASGFFFVTLRSIGVSWGGPAEANREEYSRLEINLDCRTGWVAAEEGSGLEEMKGRG